MSNLIDPDLRTWNFTTDAEKTLTYEGGVNTLDMTGGGNYERFWIQVTGLQAFRAYTFSFKFCSPSGFTTGGYDSFNEDYGFVTKDSTVSQATLGAQKMMWVSTAYFSKEPSEVPALYQCVFNPGAASTVYLAIDFGYITDGIPYSYIISDISLDTVEYSGFQDMLDAGTTNMAVLRNNVKQDDGTDTVSAGINWFHFNGAVVSNIYASGNSWIGFGSGTEHLKVNRRDCAMFYLYAESGTVNDHRFFKLRWRGYSYYSKTTDDYLQQFDLFLFDTGQLYLRFFDVPVTTGSGVNTLVCGSQTVTYAVTANTPCEYTFTPSDPAAGTGWSAASGRPSFAYNYTPSGTAVYSLPLERIVSYFSSEISWMADTPEDTGVELAAATGTEEPEEWLPCTNGGSIPCFSSGEDYSEVLLWVRVTLRTGYVHVTPRLRSLSLSIRDNTDRNCIVLVLADGNRNNLQKCAGDVTIRYANGDLTGEEEYVDNFIESFTPAGYAYKGNQNDREHFSVVGGESSVAMTRISYASAQDDKNAHFSVISASHSLTLTYIEPI